MQRGLKDAIIRAAKQRGYTLTPDWKLSDLPLTLHLRALFERHGIDAVIDVGGNLGQYHDLIRNEVGFKGPIVTFEPVSKYVRGLEERARLDPFWRVVPFALGAEEGSATINVTQSPGLNSFLEPNAAVVKGFWQDNSIASTETVSIKTLDGVLPALQSELGFTRPYLKLDTQGFDLQALKGGLASLPSFRGLQTEASVRPLYQNMPSYQEVIAFLSAHGFALSGMFPVTVDKDSRLVEFDCVAVNERFIN